MADGMYWGFLIRTTDSRSSGRDGLEVDGEMFVAFPTPDFQNRWEENLVPKLGLRVRANQAAGLQLAHHDPESDRFVPFLRSQASAQPLLSFLGATRDESWIALVPERPVRPMFLASNVASWRLQLRITPRQSGPQLVPAAVVYYRANFAPERHLAGLWVLPALTSTRRSSPGASSRRPPSTRSSTSRSAKRRRG
jgi:hypothetical protein